MEDKELTREEFLKGITDQIKVKHKSIRQLAKPISFGLNYGMYPQKLARNIKVSLDKAQELFNKYHKELYPGVTQMREEYVLPTVQANGRLHLGLGCYMHSSNPEGEIRTLFNACSQFWSILTLLTINKFNHLLTELKLHDDVQVVSTIYDSIYIHLKDDVELIKWVNDTIIPLLTANFIKDQIISNRAEAEIGYTWQDTIKVSNNASIDEIEKIRSELNAL